MPDSSAGIGMPSAPVKQSGWLRKQGGKIKTWKKRFFVLEDQNLSYFERDDGSKALKSFSVKGCDLEVLDSAHDHDPGDECDRFDFLIKPAEEGKSRWIDNHDVFFLSASTETERMMWVRALKRAMYREKGGAIFGMPLSEVCPFLNPDPAENVPTVVRVCCEYIRLHGLDEKGIFRMSGRKKAITELAQAFDRGVDPALSPDRHDIHSVCGVLKKFFSELPDPLIPFERYDELKTAGYYVDEKPELVIQHLEKLPVQNYNLLKYICRFLKEVADHSDMNMMSEDNLASVFAPNVIRCQDSDPDIEVSANPMIRRAMWGFIHYQDILFVKRFKPFQQVNAPPIPKPRLNATFKPQDESPLPSHIAVPPADPKIMTRSAEAVNHFALIKKFSNSFKRPSKNVPPPPPPATSKPIFSKLDEKSASTELLSTPAISKEEVNSSVHTKTVTSPPPSLPVPNSTPNLYPKVSDLTNSAVTTEVNPNSISSNQFSLTLEEAISRLEQVERDRDHYKLSYESAAKTNVSLNLQIEELRQSLKLRDSELQNLRKRLEKKNLC